MSSTGKKEFGACLPCQTGLYANMQLHIASCHNIVLGKDSKMTTRKLQVGSELGSPPLPGLAWGLATGVVVQITTYSHITI